MWKQLRIFALSLLASCGAKPDILSRTLQNELPDNYPVKLECFAAGKPLKEPIPVSFDDQADIRLCVSLQKDGHLGLDLRYRPKIENVKQIAALMSIRDSSGREASDVFPLVLNPQSGLHEVYLGNGCIVGQLGGCSSSATPKMQALFSPVGLDPEKVSTEAFTLELAFVSVQDEHQMHWDLQDALTNTFYTFAIPAL